LVPGVCLLLLVPLLTGYSQSARFSPVAVLIWHSAIAYGIVTRHIMGVGELLRRTITYVLLTGLLALFYFLVFRLVQGLPFEAHELRQTVSHVVAAIAVALALAPVNRFLQQKADSLFADGRDELATLLRQGSELSRTLKAVDGLLADFGRLLQDTLGLSSVRIYLRQDERFVPRFDSGNAGSGGAIPETDSLLGVLRTAHVPLLRDVLRRDGRVPSQTQAERDLARLGAEAAIPLRTGTGLAGFILLGRRHHGRIFGKGEEDALAFLGGQLGLAIENAALYTRLQDARVYNEVLLENLVTGVIATDPHGTVTVCNREAQRLLRLAGTEAAIGRLASDILPDSIAGALRASLASGQGVRDVNSVLWPQTTDEKPVCYATAVFGGRGSAAPGALLVLQDTSAIRKLEEQIRRSDRLASVGTLAAGMAHEIKNPLVCLKTFAQLLPDHYNDPDFRATFTPLLGNEVDRIDAIVSQVLNFSRPAKPRLIPLSLHAALETAWQLVDQQAKTKGLAFERQYEAEDDTLLGDPRLLGQVFLNLLLNGIDAMERGGTLTVSTRVVGCPEQARRLGRMEAKAWIDVQVRDTGGGIAPADLPRVFDPFFTTKANGTGLGLSVAHGLVMDHHGVIDVESAPGLGACFRVQLPLLSAESPAAETNPKGAV
jgi:nitrogen-specific signal transduction histidine kinase